jgi:hypothetical protein
MNQFVLGAVLIANAFYFVACGKSDSGTGGGERKLSGQDYTVLGEATLTSATDSVTGKGSLIFKLPLGEVGSAKNYNLTFSLEDGGYVTLASHTTDKLSSGAEVVLTRSDKSLSLKLKASGGETTAKTLDSIDASKAVTVSIDVHNGETPAHILVWKDGEKSPSDDNAVFNSDADGATPGNGAGTFWGLSLEKATVSEAALAEARFED